MECARLRCSIAQLSPCWVRFGKDITVHNGNVLCVVQVPGVSAGGMP